jgi:anti-sigma regulatory factor (Ser/Thr protein kinase)
MPAGDLGSPIAVSVFTPSPLAESYPPVAASVPLARRALVDLALTSGAAGDQVDAVRLAVSEAMTNAVMRSCGDIRVTGALAGDGLAVSIADDGAIPRRALFGQSEASEGRAWGLALIAQATDELAIAHQPAGGTELRMRFGLNRRT